MYAEVAKIYGRSKPICEIVKKEAVMLVLLSHLKLHGKLEVQFISA